jgi:ribonuclease HI
MDGHNIDTPTATRNSLQVYADGGCAPVNPGGFGLWAWIAFRDGAEVASAYGDLGCSPEMTNNLAEYAAFIKAAGWLHANSIQNATIYLDSRLVVEQVSGRWACRKPSLQPLLAEAKRLAHAVDVRLVWVPREHNRRADALVRRAYAEALKRENDHHAHVG